jgi:hypothetical protein
VASSDQTFQVGVAAGGIALVGILTFVRFCGSVSLPPKGPPPVVASSAENQLVARAAQSPQLYLDWLSKDANQAGVTSPTMEEMSRKLPYRVDEARHVLEVGQPAVELAGLRLRVVKGVDTFNLEIQNVTGSNAAYHVVTEPIPNASSCSTAPPLQLDVMVINKGSTETRVECAWHDGIALAVKKVETVELGALQSYYVSEVPPDFVGMDRRISRSHKGVENKQGCGNRAGSVITGIDRGEISWRDLVDFYARHRCQTYHFPASYRAFTMDGQRPLPAAEAGM